MNAGLKWLELLLEIVGYEFGHTSDGQLLSNGADRFIERHPIAGRVTILAAGTVITLHLSNVLEERFDIMSTGFWEKIRGIRA